MWILEDVKVLDEMITNEKKSVSELNLSNPVLLIFLRHLGCVFCKETLNDLLKIKENIYKMGTQIVFVHMAGLEEAIDFFGKYDFEKIQHVSDQDCVYYQKFGLSKGTFKQLFGFQSWIGMGRATLKGNSPEKILGDPAQMPGIFLIHNNKVLKSFVYKSVGDYPDFLNLATK